VYTPLIYNGKLLIMLIQIFNSCQISARTCTEAVSVHVAKGDL
jgi:hypothetical protein